jgi:mannose-6-phosphate isomerase-like protein (cupin superfamily)
MAAFQIGRRGDRMKNVHWILVAAATAALCAAARADVFPKEGLIRNDRKEVAGGHGTVVTEYAFTRDKAKKDDAIKEVSWLRLMPGDSIGYHPHVANEDVYVIVSGEGTFKDKDGKDKPVKAGDVAIVRKGESHGIANTGKEPLVIVDVIAEQ